MVRMTLNRLVHGKGKCPEGTAAYPFGLGAGGEEEKGETQRQLIKSERFSKKVWGRKCHGIVTHATRGEEGKVAAISSRSKTVRREGTAVL